jgi:Ni2+-binding GTPase involved in maturation of urease and hydrogenase
MKLHIVGGFLGSGKTTAIAAAARALMARGQRVGIVTNDQGKYLVDTAFFRALRLPAVEVTGGCFCCNYDDLDARLAELEANAQPEVIFAESVGSCADIVATVIKPLLTLRTSPASFSVFADSRLLLQRLRGLPLPFSDDVVYIFDAQLEEAGLLVANKVDLLQPADANELRDLISARWPGKAAILQHTLGGDGAADWLALLEAAAPPPAAAPLEIDYQRYGAGEAELAWLDMRLTVQLPDRDGQAFLGSLARALATALEKDAIPVGHLKLATVDAARGVKISQTGAHDAAWLDAVPPLTVPSLTLIINLRAQAPAGQLETLAGLALAETIKARGAVVTDSALDRFHPGFPTPTHHMA